MAEFKGGSLPSPENSFDMVIAGIKRAGGLQSKSGFLTANQLEKLTGRFFSGEVGIDNIPRGSERFNFRTFVRQEAIRRNALLIEANAAGMLRKGSDFRETLMGESLGGNAGQWSCPELGIDFPIVCGAVNGAVDKLGQIAGFGNYLHSDSRYKGKFKDGTLKDLIFRVIVPFPPENPPIGRQIVGVYLEEKAIDPRSTSLTGLVLIESAKRYNELENSRAKTRLVIDPRTL